MALQANERLLWAKKIKRANDKSKSYKEIVRHAHIYWQDKEDTKA